MWLRLPHPFPCRTCRTGALVVGWAADRYGQRGETFGLISRGLTRLFERDLQRGSAVESASFVVGYRAAQCALPHRAPCPRYTADHAHHVRRRSVTCWGCRAARSDRPATSRWRCWPPPPSRSSAPSAVWNEPNLRWSHVWNTVLFVCACLFVVVQPVFTPLPRSVPRRTSLRRPLLPVTVCYCLLLSVTVCYCV